MILRDWAMILSTGNTIISVNEKIFESIFKKPLMENLDMVRLIGKIYDREDYSDGEVLITGTLKSLTAENAVSISESNYQLENKNEHYFSLNRAVEKKLPIVYNWSLYLNSKGSMYLVGHMFRYSNKIYPFIAEIISQNTRESTLHLSYFGEVFVDWRSYNSFQESNLESVLKPARPQYFWDFYANLPRGSNKIMIIHLINLTTDFQPEIFHLTKEEKNKLFFNLEDSILQINKIINEPLIQP